MPLLVSHLVKTTTLTPHLALRLISMKHPLAITSSPLPGVFITFFNKRGGGVDDKRKRNKGMEGGSEWPGRIIKDETERIGRD